MHTVANFQTMRRKRSQSPAKALEKRRQVLDHCRIDSTQSFLGDLTQYIFGSGNSAVAGIAPPDTVHNPPQIGTPPEALSPPEAGQLLWYGEGVVDDPIREVLSKFVHDIPSVGAIKEERRITTLKPTEQFYNNYMTASDKLAKGLRHLQSMIITDIKEDIREFLNNEIENTIQAVYDVGANYVSSPRITEEQANIAHSQLCSIAANANRNLHAGSPERATTTTVMPAFSKLFTEDQMFQGFTAADNFLAVADTYGMAYGTDVVDKKKIAIDQLKQIVHVLREEEENYNADNDLLLGRIKSLEARVREIEKDPTITEKTDFTTAVQDIIREFPQLRLIPYEAQVSHPVALYDRV